MQFQALAESTFPLATPEKNLTQLGLSREQIRKFKLMQGWGETVQVHRLEMPTITGRLFGNPGGSFLLDVGDSVVSIPFSEVYRVELPYQSWLFPGARHTESVGRLVSDDLWDEIPAEIKRGPRARIILAGIIHRFGSDPVKSWEAGSAGFDAASTLAQRFELLRRPDIWERAKPALERHLPEDVFNRISGAIEDTTARVEALEKGGHIGWTALC
ncbi:MAG TPA: hypothetical protein VEY30_01105 [Myxococcaceae bacterium]|nr:hypothetical protein [Myxococcaceae bacterium]